MQYLRGRATGFGMSVEWERTRVQGSKFNVQGPKRIETLDFEHPCSSQDQG
jgi:hypothetical protein